MKYSIKECCDLFEIKNINKIELCEIKKKYHKLCLKYHPDKCKNNNINKKIDFIYLKDCYDILVKVKQRENYINHFDNEFDIYNYFLSFINVSNIEKIYNWFQNYNYIVQLYVDFNSLFNKELYYVDNNVDSNVNDIYYVPLWCKQITNIQINNYLKRQNSHNEHITWMVNIKNIQSNIQILDNNDIIVYIKNVEKYLNKYIKINLCDAKTIDLFIDQTIKNTKYHILLNEGIPRFNIYNIYDFSQVSSIIICFY
jgi:hypothetical protein